MTSEQFQAIRSKVNKACNFWADTIDVDYVEGLSAAEIMEQYAIDKDMIKYFPELREIYK